MTSKQIFNHLSNVDLDYSRTEELTHVYSALWTIYGSHDLFPEVINDYLELLTDIINDKFEIDEKEIMPRSCDKILKKYDLKEEDFYKEKND